MHGPKVKGVVLLKRARTSLSSAAKYHLLWRRRLESIPSNHAVFLKLLIQDELSRGGKAVLMIDSCRSGTRFSLAGVFGFKLDY